MAENRSAMEKLVSLSIFLANFWMWLHFLVEAQKSNSVLRHNNSGENGQIKIPYKEDWTPWEWEQTEAIHVGNFAACRCFKYVFPWEKCINQPDQFPFPLPSPPSRNLLAAAESQSILRCDPDPRMWAAFARDCFGWDSFGGKQRKSMTVKWPLLIHT